MVLSCTLVSVSKDLMEPEVARTAIEDLAIGLTEGGHPGQLSLVIKRRWKEPKLELPNEVVYVNGRHLEYLCVTGRLLKLWILIM